MDNIPIISNILRLIIKLLIKIRSVKGYKKDLPFTGTASVI